MDDRGRSHSFQKNQTTNANVYVQGEDRKLPTFKALADTWKSPEIKLWHKHLGDFWGPIILHMRRFNEWMPLHEAFNTGVDHAFIGKTNDEIIEAWRRGECDPIEDIQGIFKNVIAHIQPAYAKNNHRFDDNLWQQLNIQDIAMQVAVPLELNESKMIESLPMDPGKSEQASPQWCVDMAGLIRFNKEAIMELIIREDPNLQQILEDMAERMKAMWKHATEGQKAAWVEMKKNSFGATELHTKPIDVIFSFESR
jgi:hypothetical protein